MPRAAAQQLAPRLLVGLQPGGSHLRLRREHAFHIPAPAAGDREHREVVPGDLHVRRLGILVPTPRGVRANRAAGGSHQRVVGIPVGSQPRGADATYSLLGGVDIPAPRGCRHQGVVHLHRHGEAARGDVVDGAFDAGAVAGSRGDARQRRENLGGWRDARALHLEHDALSLLALARPAGDRDQGGVEHGVGRDALSLHVFPNLHGLAEIREVRARNHRLLEDHDARLDAGSRVHGAVVQRQAPQRLTRVDARLDQGAVGVGVGRQFIFVGGFHLVVEVESLLEGIRCQGPNLGGSAARAEDGVDHGTVRRHPRVVHLLAKVEAPPQRRRHLAAVDR